MKSKNKKKGRNTSASKSTGNNEIRGIVLIALSIITAIALFVGSDGSLMNFIKNILISLLGLGAYVSPILLLFLGYCVIWKSDKRGVYNVKFYGSIAMGILLLIFMQLINMDVYYTESYSEAVENIIKSTSIYHGGILGLTIALPLYKMLGTAGTMVVIITLFIILLILMFNFSVYELGLKYKSNMQTIKDKAAKKRAIASINVSGKDDEDEEEVDEGKKDDFINGINNKIKILDFMKNSALEEETAVDATQNNNREVNKNAEEKPTPIINEYSGNKKDNKKVDEAIKEEVNKEIYDNISIVSDGIVEYSVPSVDFLNENTLAKMNKEDRKELLQHAAKLKETLNSFGVDATVSQVTKGPSVTRFEIQPSAGVKVSKIVNLADDIALSLAAKGVRIEAPIPGKSAIGIEVPNRDLTPVLLREVIESDEYINTSKNLAVGLGKDIGGKCVVADLTKMPHLLIAGATGSGKSVCINTLIISLLYKYSPEDVKLLMVDPKVVELNVYNGIPQLLIPVVTEPKKAAAALNWAVNEMERRYKIFADNGVRNIEGVNELYARGKIAEKFPWIVIIVDELADLMMVCPHDVEDYIARLAQKARAAGMHLVIATQRPSVDVITGVIKANVPSRISFAVSSQIDSRTIIDSAGAEKLLGKGDMLFYPVGESKPLRVQGAFISEEEVEKVVNFIKGQQQEPVYEETILEHINNESTGNSSNDSGSDEDELLEEAIREVIESGQASTSFIQRRLRIGFNRASRIMDELEERRIISPKDGSKPRQVIVDRSYLDRE